MGFSGTDITHYSNEGEADFARDYPCIVERISIAIVAGTAIYTLPEYVIDIRKITWNGKRMFPLTHRTYREAFNEISTGAAPEYYVVNNIGQMQIRFFPIPSVNVAELTDDLWGDNIGNCVIVEYFRTPDFIDNLIPDFIRDKILNAYAMKNCYAMDGRLQNLKAAKYWNNQWGFLKNLYGMLLETLINEPRRLIIGPAEDRRGYFIPQPRLPYDMDAIDVDDGY
jgi:hypothetical protein